MDTKSPRAIARTLRATLIDGRKLFAELAPDGIAFKGGAFVELVPLDVTAHDFLARWDRYLEAHGVDVGRRWPVEVAS